MFRFVDGVAGIDPAAAVARILNVPLLKVTA
jgi:adenine/guanine phosphoribosyltransferase-like PRPP-binding protein